MNRRTFLTGFMKATATVAFLGVARLSIADDRLWLDEGNLVRFRLDPLKRVDDAGLIIDPVAIQVHSSGGKSRLANDLLLRKLYFS